MIKWRFVHDIVVTNLRCIYFLQPMMFAQRL